MIILDATDLAGIAAAAEAAFPAEGCGLLIGSGQEIVRVSRVIAANNLERERRNDRFELDPSVRFAAERSLRGGAERVVGHWHSHPNGRSHPSAEDIARAFEPDLIWLIIGVMCNDDKLPHAHAPLAYRLNAEAGTIRPEQLHIRSSL
ncbi:M67 family metallopeptidase [Magnetospirillum molischianum]|uniref:Mov34/MPN/PAD-1 n=1 Tax=Magnetospirillum molischianum DSM 120 TaxID=1150626 RepID=H8FQP4_MAGML|nr:M67 family metallopeptidase [Magnetospirillum molischianum]CCG40682.1 Mov34/MPN/PAD-1 [Magnetospirillum molischianum DSM 120]